MKKLIAILFIIFALPAYADSIKCYSHGKLIYSRHVYDVTYTGEVYVFIEEASDKMVIFNGDCVAKIYG
jgi:hypothetical protein